MGRYFRRRLLTAIPVFFGITFLVFVLLSLSPADVTDLGEGASGGAQQAALEEALGLDKPLPVRYLAWLGGLLRGELVKQTRSACLESLGEDYILTARAKGLGERAVMVRHAFRGALTPVLTTVLGHIPHIIGGSVVVEQVFGWPGMGSLLFWGIENRDYPVVMGVTVVIALAVLLTNLLLDLAYGLADPRVRYGRG